MTGVKEKSNMTHAPQLPACVDPPTPCAAASERPFADLDRGLRAGVALATGGLSPHSFVEAWSDWVMHLARSPGPQLDLVRHAQASVWKLITHFATPQSGVAQPFAPKPHDRRFGHEGWQEALYHIWQQGFLAVQDWWDEATSPIRGMRSEDADRARFVSRQILDTMSPSNFPLLNPEIVAATRGEWAKIWSRVQGISPPMPSRSSPKDEIRRQKVIASETVWRRRWARWCSETICSN